MFLQARPIWAHIITGGSAVRVQYTIITLAVYIIWTMATLPETITNWVAIIAYRVDAVAIYAALVVFAARAVAAEFAIRVAD